MFEGNPPLPPAGPGAATSAVDGAELRPLVWSELTARLAAMRDLRATLAIATSASSSFAAPFAAQVALLENGKAGVNPSDLANGKGPECIAGWSRDTAADRPRGSQ